MSYLTYSSLRDIQDEVQHLVQIGAIGRHQPIYVLCQYIPAQEWIVFEQMLEEHNFLLRDRIADLIPNEDWGSDL